MMDTMTVKRTASKARGEWSKAKVAQIASIITGPFGTLLKASEYGGAEGVPLISVGEIREGFLRVTDETPTVSAIVTKRLPQYLLREGDIVFGRKGGVERSAIINRHQVGWFLGSDGISIRLKEGFHRSFFGHAFRSSTVQSWLLQNASGTTMPSLNQAILGAVEIPFPEDTKEQEAIAEALSDADALIEGLERLIAKKRLLKQGAMQDLLTAKRRLPGFSGEWVDSPLGEIARLYQPVTISAKKMKEHGFPVYGANGVVGSFDQYNHETWQCIITCRGSTCGTVNRTVNKSWITGNAMVANIDANPKVDKNFFYQALLGQDFSTCITGTGQPQIVRGPLAAFQMNLPASLEEQQAVAEVLNDMDVEIQALETRLAKARQVKEGMMQNLLTGRIRLV